MRRLFCVRPAGLPGGVIVVATDDREAVAMLQNIRWSDPAHYLTSLALEAEYMNVEGIPGPSRVACVLKGVVSIKCGTSSPSDTKANGTSHTGSPAAGTPATARAQRTRLHEPKPSD